MYPAATRQSVLRRQWSIQGQVQGVGFRPFVYRLAQVFSLTGLVRNDTQGVTIEAQGTAEQLERFSRALEEDRPSLATFEHIRVRTMAAIDNEPAFCIEPSHSHVHSQSAHAAVTVDIALCDDCRRELFTPGDPREKYALINCTNCGPRFSIVRRVPYDRPNTTMADFVMCPSCHAQYTDPGDRRFHAQPIACPTCGPRVTLVDRVGRSITKSPISKAAEMLTRGGILAVKGIGGFHLAVRADQDKAVQYLRQRKHRDHKPFALMVRDVAAAHRLVELSPQGLAMLESPAAPIVLAPRRDDAALTVAVAPQSHRLGVMLPYTPLHELIWHALDPDINALVMTSGNLSDEPLVIDHADALERLGRLCDALLWHDRPIERCVDDSVVLDQGDDLGVVPLRRSRGFAPSGLPVMDACVPGLCLGGELKNTVAVVREGQAMLSQHLGDLTHPLALAHFKRAADDLCQLFDVQPKWIAHDMHPMYLSTQHAMRLAERLGVPRLAVQHHHAHAASLLAEHETAGPMLALVCDGVGYGDDGTSWGGELLLATTGTYRRLAHLRQLALPGGDAAARDLRRSAAAALHLALGVGFDQHPAMYNLLDFPDERDTFCHMLRSGFGCLPTSAAGRWFDAVAALLGVTTRNDYEAQAPMRLETLAASWPDPIEPDSDAAFAIHSGDTMCVLDPSPFVRWMLAEDPSHRPVAEMAACFHEALARAWAKVIQNQAEHTGVSLVGLTGGCFANEILTGRLTRLLGEQGLTVLTHRRVPPGDGGIAFGQAAVACAWISQRKAGA